MAHQQRRLAGFGIAALLGMFAADALFAAPPLLLMRSVDVTAWAEAEDGHPGDILVEVEVDGTFDWGRPDADGRVDLVLPANAVAVLRFRKPGHLTKEVSVDTHHVFDGSFNSGRRHLSFGVVLEQRKSLDGLAYAGPVGAIAFDADGGCMTVEHDRRLVPAARQQRVVF